MSFDINSLSAIAAIFAAGFAWKSVGAARKQNTIAGQVALLEYLLQKSSRIEGMRIETAKLFDWNHEHFSYDNDKFKDKDKIDMESLTKDVIFSQQKATNVIFCYHHYFKIEDVCKLKTWLDKLERCKDLSECKKIANNSPLIEFNCEIIPNMLENIEKDILSIEQKLRENV